MLALVEPSENTSDRAELDSTSNFFELSASPPGVEYQKLGYFL